MPATYTKPGQLPETLRLQLVKTYGDETTKSMNPDELDIASAIACFDVLVEREEFTDGKFKELLTLMNSKEERSRQNWSPRVWKEVFRTLEQV